MSPRKWSLAFAVLGGVCLLNASAVQAGLIPAAVNIANDGPNFRFTYSVVLPSDYTLKDGDYFSIYDFKGLVGGSNAQPAGWDFSSAATGVTPPHIGPVDDPSIPNLTWTYHGADIKGPQGLGDFSAASTFGEKGAGDFTSKDHGTADGRAVGSITSTVVPDTAGPRDAPEPASLALFGIALPILGAWRCLRRRK